MKANKHSGILLRLIKLYTEFSRIRHANTESQMCHFWENPTIEVFEGSEELVALETEFGIQIDEETALDLYDMKLKEAAEFIESVIKVQQGNKGYKSVQTIEKLSPIITKRVLCEIWLGSFRGRSYITSAIDKISYEENLKKTKNASMRSKYVRQKTIKERSAAEKK